MDPATPLTVYEIADLARRARRPLIPAQCVVDVVEAPYKFRVFVWGAEKPFQQERRAYEITAASEDEAAKAGIGMFVREIAAMFH
jgi:hypothetical protein